MIAVGLSTGRAWPANDTLAPQAAPASPQAIPGAPDKKPADAAPAEATTPPVVTVIDAVDARGILGRDVRSPTGDNMGRIADVIVDRGGQTRAAVIDFGGFLGVGSRKIVVDWSALRFGNVANKSESISLGLTREQVRAAPEYKDDQPIVALGASGKLEPLRYPPLNGQEK
ncbi:PRC-barrel domain-containing protein [Rhodopseudomonas sp. P2A-2r]|uniref:PRC-barrel domain-containing protein n=1 Tax=Rhodopseudomonas sp. P2A-2r TaxID=2991972 RepID=UPI0022341165|nr:PRC-barrel domain-containing protein [Rhodopseudomonas sp. P2A-2r]UZE49585.1 PRC-barrel domain-containing protein [Rhodopseudomonas sp. P2A-2r]